MTKYDFRLVLICMSLSVAVGMAMGAEIQFDMDRKEIEKLNKELFENNRQ